MSFLQPKNMVEGSGLLDDVDVTVKESRIVVWDYNGKVYPAVPAIKWVMELEDESLVEQYWSIGKATEWAPNEDGTKLVALGKQTGINKSTNGAILLTSAVNAGFPENKIDEITCFDGLKAHMIRIPAPKRAGLAPRAPREDGKTYDDTILTVKSVISLPWEKKGGGAKAPAPAKTKAAASGTPPSAPDGVKDEATTVLVELLSENPDGISKNQIPPLAFKKLGSNPNRNTILAVLFSENFLSSGPWTYADGKVTLG